MEERVYLEVKTQRTGLETPEAMGQILASLANIKTPSSLFKKVEIPFSFEIALIDQTIHFFVTTPKQYQSFVESQLLSQYPKASIIQLPHDSVSEMLPTLANLSFGQMKLQYNHLYPLRTTKDFKDIDPMSSILGLLSKLGKDDIVLIQFLLVPIGSGWQKSGQKALERKNAPKVGTEPPSDPLGLSTYSADIKEKLARAGFKTGIRILVKSDNPALLGLTAATFTSFNNPAGNSLALSVPQFWQKNRFLDAILTRSPEFIPSSQILNLVEVSTMIHFAGEKLATIPNISWSKTLLSDSPENLPVAINFGEEEKKDVNFFARTEYKNKPTVFGILRKDRRRHVYIIGKTGTGKSTLIANLAINDIRNGEGLGVIDPHGDLSEILLDYVPSYRVNDVVYLNPADVNFPFRINPLEVDDPSEKELVASGIVSIFYKLYHYSWGPRLEYILRNVLLTLLEVPNATLLQIPELLTNGKFRKGVVDGLTDPVLKNFWIYEFERMDDKQRNEAISPILNKVGQFLSSPMIRNILSSPKSTLNFADIMDNGKIMVLNLSQGKIGEDSAALLGAMIITKLQLAAMSRVSVPEARRRDFYLYVDEFQNFATTSFVKILSEARKYRLNLILANQYTAQVQEDVRSAIFGNAGTIMSFLVGAQDAPILAKEFSERFKLEDLLALGNFQMIIKMAINDLTSEPFFAQSLPLPQSVNQNREKVIRSSRERYTRQEKPKDLPPITLPPEPAPAIPVSQPSPSPKPSLSPRPPQHSQAETPRGDRRWHDRPFQGPHTQPSQPTHRPEGQSRLVSPLSQPSSQPQQSRPQPPRGQNVYRSEKPHS